MNNYLKENLDESSKDILKLNLLGETLKELDKPLAELIETKQLSIDKIHIDSITNELTISVKSENTLDSHLLNQLSNTLTNIINNSLSELR